ncbi:hypothetical protein [Aestuariivirga sp.]|uniref:hypothetical protein n=1 Tax=Aestuariivirga sp. TaxID=2650926 RepID=UPI003593729C
MLNPFAPAGRQDVMCTVHVVNTFDNLAAHVELDDGVKIEPGDEVLVHGKPIIVPYGETMIERRKATITRANWLEKRWVKLTGDLEFMELLEFSFSGEEL